MAPANRADWSEGAGRQPMPYLDFIVFPVVE